MKDSFETIVIALLITIVIVIIVTLAAFPFFLVGWASTLLAALFTGNDVAVGYWANAGVGLAAVVTVGLIRSLLVK